MLRNRGAKLIIGALSVLPIVIALAFITVSGFMFTRLFRVPGLDPSGIFSAMFTLQAFAMVWTVSLLAFYLWYLFYTDRVPADKKALWTVVFLLVSIMAFPVFWYFYIWRDAGPPQRGSNTSA
jgi:magnesium-transporting ATPase (P-type)